MAKVYNISDSVLFHRGSKARKYEASHTVRANPWGRVVRAISSPMAIVGYFILLLVGCSRLH